MRSKETRGKPNNGSAPAKSEHPINGSYFLSLEVENVRSFSEKQVLDFSDGKGRPARWTILLGENGTGKTTLLQLLAAFELTPISAEWNGVTFREFRFLSRPFIHIWLRDAGALKPSVKCSFVGCTTLAGTNQSGVPCERLVESMEHAGIPTGTQGCSLDPPVSYAYHAGRRSGRSSLAASDRDQSAELPFAEENDLINAEEWLLRLDYSASKQSRIQDQQKNRLEMVKGILIDVLPDVSDIRFSAPTIDKPTPAVQFKTPYGWVQLRQLGYGYRTMIAWIVDLASRLVERYPESPNPLAEPAVVLVDEIDLHLHPKWQRELIGFLTERFPNTQFIATAHSPLLVQSAGAANIALLKREGDHVVIENNPETIRGWRLDQIVTSDLFGLETARPPEVEKPLLRRKELLTKPTLTKSEREELKRIDTQLRHLPTGESFEQAKTMELIQQSLEILKKKQSTKK